MLMRILLLLLPPLQKLSLFILESDSIAAIENATSIVRIVSKWNLFASHWAMQNFAAFHISRVCVCVFMHECFCVCVTTAVQSKSPKSNVSVMAVAASDSAASTIILCVYQQTFYCCRAAYLHKTFNQEQQQEQQQHRQCNDLLAVFICQSCWAQCCSPSSSKVKIQKFALSCKVKSLLDLCGFEAAEEKEGKRITNCQQLLGGLIRTYRHTSKF